MPTIPPIPSGWPIALPGLLMAYVGPLLYVRWSEGHSSEAERVHLTELRRALDARTDGVRVGVVYEFRNTDGIPALGRSDLARLLNERKEILQKTTAAYALVTDSLLTRASLKAVFWIAPPPYPHTTVSDLDAGLRFVADHQRELDPVRARRECDALCDAYAEKLRAKPA